MSKSVSLAGASYQNVPAIILPLASGNGSAKFTDTSASTITAERIVSGYGAYDSSGNWVDGTSDGENIVVQEAWMIEGDSLLIAPDLTYDSIASGSTPSGGVNLSGTTIVDYAFAYRTSAVSWSVNGPNITSIGQNSFRECAYLTSAKFPILEYQQNNDYEFYNDTRLSLVDFGLCDISEHTFANCASLETLILRKPIIAACASSSALSGTPFASGGTGGTIYIPESLYDHLGDGSSSDYKAATSWSVYDGYGTITWAKIEGSEYELDS